MPLSIGRFSNSFPVLLQREIMTRELENNDVHSYLLNILLHNKLKRNKSFSAQLRSKKVISTSEDICNSKPSTIENGSYSLLMQS